MKEQIWKLVDEVADFTVAARRRFHENPELGFQEYATTAFIKKELEAAGVEIVPINMETGALAVIRGTAEGKGAGDPPVVGVRADMDALPIAEETGVPYASKVKGIMHACGHDGHAAILLGLAKVLQKLRPHFAGTVKLFFQPAEETLYGAERMLACGVMENPKPAAVVALHGGVELPIGTVGVYPGPFMASADLFKVKFIGKGTHAAYPHKGTDALAAAAQAVISLQMLLAREVEVNERAVVSVCQIHGGHAFNVVPEEVEIGGTVRCLSPDVRKQISERLRAICSDIASSYRCRAECEYTFGIPSLANDPDVTEDIARAAAAMLGEDKVVRIANPIMGGEDFAYFLQKAPGAMFRLGIGGDVPMLTHNPGFNFADESVPAGIAVLAKYVTEFLNPEGK